MTDQHRNEESGQDETKWAMALSLGAGFGVVIGTVVFAITGNAFWIAIGPAFGAAIAVAFRALD